MGCEPLGFSPFLSKMFLVVVKQGLGDHRNYPWSMAVILLVFWSLGLTKDCWFRVSKKIQETREGRGDQLCTDWHHVDSKELEWPWDGATSTTPFQPHPNAQWFNLRDMIRPQNDKPIHAVCRLNQFLGGWIGEMLLPLAPFITLFYVQNRPGFRLCVDILKTDWSPAWTLQYLGYAQPSTDRYGPLLCSLTTCQQLMSSRFQDWECLRLRPSCLVLGILSVEMVRKLATGITPHDETWTFRVIAYLHGILSHKFMYFDRAYQQIVNTKLAWHLLQHTIDTMSWARYWKVRLFSFHASVGRWTRHILYLYI